MLKCYSHTSHELFAELAIKIKKLFNHSQVNIDEHRLSAYSLRTQLYDTLETHKTVFDKSFQTFNQKKKSKLCLTKHCFNLVDSIFEEDE